MSGTQPSVSALFELLAQHSAGLCERVGAREAGERLELVKTLVARLPHAYLLAATREEIQRVGRAMAGEGRSRGEMRLLQETLVGLFDHAVMAGLLQRHPLRDYGGAPAATQAPPAALVLGLPPPLARAVRGLLAAQVQVHAEPNHAQGLECIRWFPFAFILTTLPPFAPVSFFGAVRAPGSPCRSAGLVLLAKAVQEREAGNFLGRGANRVVVIGELAERLPSVIAELGTVRQRTRLRVAVEVDLDEGRDSASWQSENVSSTGMLMRTPAEVPVGSEVDLQFAVPGDDLPIHVRARVVRRTTFARESFTGVGVQFLSFVGEGQHRLEQFLRRQRQAGPA